MRDMELYRSYIGVIWRLYGDNGEKWKVLFRVWGLAVIGFFFNDYTGTHWVWSLSLGYRATVD